MPKRKAETSGPERRRRRRRRAAGKHLTTPTKRVGNNDNNNSNNSSNNNNNATRNRRIVPRLMVLVNNLVVYPIVNEFYDDIRKTFVFNEQACCGKTFEGPPGEDESVLHLRNFATEMKESSRKRLGFEELGSSRLVSEVLGHLKDGDKLALVGRGLESDAQNNKTEAYEIVKALASKNLTLRFAPSGNNGVEDFCFLTHTRKELIGSSKSTYMALAAYLAAPGLERARMYQFVTPRVAHRGGGSSLEIFRATVGFNWTHPELRSRVQFEEYF